jgi:hypothetical protein
MTWPQMCKFQCGSTRNMKKKNNITPPKVNYSTIMNYNDNEVMKSQTWIQKNDYKNYQRN